jgi:hypothetical protein
MSLSKRERKHLNNLRREIRRKERVIRKEKKKPWWRKLFG